MFHEKTIISDIILVIMVLCVVKHWSGTWYLVMTRVTRDVECIVTLTT